MSSILEKKKKFAIALLHSPSQSFECAKEVFGDDIGSCLKFHNAWKKDLEVRQFQADYIKEFGAETTLPSKETMAREVYEVAHDSNQDPETRLKFYKLYGDVQGYIQKPGTTINNNTQLVSNKVMVIKDKGTDEEWEEQLRLQQVKLIDDSKQ